MTPVDDGVYANISDVDYHADRDSLSSSGARKLLDSPAKFRWLMDQPVETAKHFDVGHFVHALILGVGQPVVVIEFDSYRSKAAQEERDAAYAAGKIPMLVGDVAECKAMAEAVLAHPTAAALLSEGTPELSAYWHDIATKVRLRARFDWLRVFASGRRPILADVKTSGTPVGPDSWGSTAAKFRLHFQNAWYVKAVREVGIHDDAGFVFINVEKDPPHLVSLTQLPTQAIDLGAASVRKSIDLYAQCRDTDTWPGYGDEIHVVDLPRWAYYTANNE